MNKQAIFTKLIEVAANSPAKKRKVGAIIVSANGNVLAEGYNFNMNNGPCEDEQTGETVETVLHAEIACLYDLERTRGGSLGGDKMYISHMPCTGCQAELKKRRMEWEVVRKDPSIKEEPKMSNVDATLAERGSVYGTFKDNAYLTQKVMDLWLENSKRLLSSAEKEALHMIAHKVSRIICGAKTKKDNWHDIAGYAKLVEDLTVDQ